MDEIKEMEQKAQKAARDALEEFDQKYKKEKEALEKKEKRLTDKFTEDQRARLEKIIDQRDAMKEEIKKKGKKIDIIDWISIILVIGIYAIIMLNTLTTKGIQENFFFVLIGFFAFMALVSIPYEYVKEKIFKFKALGKKIDELTINNEDKKIKEYFEIQKEKYEKEENYKKDRKPLREDVDRYDSIFYKIGSAIVKGSTKVIEYAESLQSSSTTEEEYTHQVNDNGTTLKLKKFDNSGYDTTHGWHDTYKDNVGNSWGTTDGGKTFFKK